MTTSMERELEALGRFRMGKIIGGKWKIVQKLDEGGFGSVYKVQSVKDSKIFGALKIELSRPDEANHLKLETEVMKDLHAEGFRAHIPTLYRSGKKKTYCYMIISLLGENLKRLKEKHFSKGMPLRTLTRVGIQALYAIKTMHDRGYVHRDIKPGNFVLGYHSLPPVARFVYIIDFGLARAFAYPPPKGAPAGSRWLSRRARATLDFKGTWRFASPAMHEEKEQGRKDDIWSFLYMLIDLYCELPWGDQDDKKTVEVKKLNISDNDLMTRMPDEFKFIPKHLRSLDVYQRPDYYRIFLALDKVRAKSQFASFDDAYEWELRDSAQANKSAMRKLQPPPGYTHADGFFNWDPLLICGAPSAKDELEIKERFRRAAREASLGTRTGGEQSSDNFEGTDKREGRSPSFHKDAKSVQKSATSTAKLTGKSGKSGSRTRIGKSNGASPNPSSRKKRSTSEDSADFIPSCYMNVDIPKHYLIDGKDDQKEIQKGVVKVDWGRMADGKGTCEKMPTHSGEPFSKDSKENMSLSTEKLPPSAEVIRSAEPIRDTHGPPVSRQNDRKTQSGRVPNNRTSSKNSHEDKRGIVKAMPFKDNRKTKKSLVEVKKKIPIVKYREK